MSDFKFEFGDLSTSPWWGQVGPLWENCWWIIRTQSGWVSRRRASMEIWSLPKNWVIL